MRSFRFLGIMLLVISAFATFAAYAAASQVIYACVGNKGQLRVVGIGTPGTCKNSEEPLQFNQQGPPGVQGPPGIQGPPGQNATGAAELVDVNGTKIGVAVTYTRSNNFGVHIAFGSSAAFIPLNNNGYLDSNTGLLFAYVSSADSEIYFAGLNCTGAPYGEQEVNLLPGYSGIASLESVSAPGGALAIGLYELDYSSGSRIVSFNSKRQIDGTCVSPWAGIGDVFPAIKVRTINAVNLLLWQ